MNETDLIKILSTRLSRKEAETLASGLASSVSTLIEITLHTRKEIAFRAAWLLEMVFDRYPSEFVPHVNHFIRVYAVQEKQSCLRHYTKILMSLTSGKAGAGLPALDDVLEVTFKWLIDPETAVAVRVNCMDILFNIRGNYDWLAEELEAQVHLYLKTGSAAMQSRGNKILDKLRSKRRQS